MKKRSLAAALLAAVLTASACGTGAQQTAAPAATTAAPAETVSAETTAAETTSAEPETTSAASSEETKAASAADTAESGEDEGFHVTKTLLYTTPFDKKYYMEDTVKFDEEFGMATYDTALVRSSTGIYHDSDSEPSLFIPDEFVYNGETAGIGTVYQVKANDVWKGLTVSSAETMLSCYLPEGGSDYNAYPFSSLVTFDGEVTLTGIVRYYFNDQYMISSGDMHFIPDSSYKGLPLSFGISGMDTIYGTRDLDTREDFSEDSGYGDDYWGGNVCVYSDAPCFCIGNLLTDEALKSDTALIELLDGAKADCTKRVEITLGNIELHWSDQFGTTRCCGVIKSIKAV